MPGCSKSKRNGIGTIFRFLRDFMSAAPFTAILTLVLNLAIALVPAAVSLFTGLITQRINAGTGVGFATGVAGLMIMLALNQGLFYLTDPLHALLIERAQNRMNALFLKKIKAIELIEFEKTDKLDRIFRLRKWLNEYKLVDFFFSLRFQIINFISLVSLIITLVAFTPWLAAIGILSALPSLLVRLVEGKKYFKMQLETENLERNRAYFWSLFRTGSTAKEILTYGAGGYFLSNCKKTDLEMTTKMYKFAHFHSLLLLAATVFAAAGYAAGLGFAAYMTAAGTLAVSGFSASVSAFLSIQNSVFNMSAEAGYLRETSSCLFEYYWFLDIKAENEKSLNQLRFEKLEVKNVCFAYPEGKEVLKNVSFSLYKGKHIAIVGENGSGKTTLVKLISGVYMPSKGEILINGIKVDPQIAVDFRGLFTLMNQNYIKYKGDVKENIFLSAPELREDKEKMQDLLSSSALSEDGLTLDLTLGREYDGAELSEGQWQQLAFLRALFKRYEIILLDEPTSAIDSENEHKLLAGFVKAMQDKSAVIVTHRLSLCRFADEILFLDGGRIVERGSHDELMEKGGKYCRMYEMQSKWYK